MNRLRCIRRRILGSHRNFPSECLRRSWLVQFLVVLHNWRRSWLVRMKGLLERMMGLLERMMELLAHMIERQVRMTELLGHMLGQEQGRTTVMSSSGQKSKMQTGSSGKRSTMGMGSWELLSIRGLGRKKRLEQSTRRLGQMSKIVSMTYKRLVNMLVLVRTIVWSRMMELW